MSLIIFTLQSYEQKQHPASKIFYWFKLIEPSQYFCTFAPDLPHLQKQNNMPKTKNSEIRIKVIDKCLRIGGFSTQAMLEAVNKELETRGLPGVRALNTIRADIRYIMTQPDIKIIKEEEGTSATYRYENPETSIYKLQLNETEIGQLAQCMTLLSKFEGMPQMEWLKSFVERFQESINIDTDMTAVVGFDENKYLSGLEHFTPLLQAILNKSVIELRYRNFRTMTQTWFIVHPYYLKEYNNRWFLIAKTEGREEELSNYAFDRIEKVKRCKKIKYNTNTTHDFNDDYFTEMIGVSKPKKRNIEEVRIWISQERTPYIETKPIHESQKLKKNKDGSSIVQLKLYVNKELEQLILSNGDEMVVLSPPFLAERIRRRLQSALQRYELQKTNNKKTMD